MLDRAAQSSQMCRSQAVIPIWLSLDGEALESDGAIVGQDPDQSAELAEGDLGLRPVLDGPAATQLAAEQQLLALLDQRAALIDPGSGFDHRRHA